MQSVSECMLSLFTDTSYVMCLCGDVLCRGVTEVKLGMHVFGVSGIEGVCLVRRVR